MNCYIGKVNWYHKLAGQKLLFGFWTNFLWALFMTCHKEPSLHGCDGVGAIFGVAWPGD